MGNDLSTYRKLTKTSDFTRMSLDLPSLEPMKAPKQVMLEPLFEHNRVVAKLIASREKLVKYDSPRLNEIKQA